MNRFVVAEPSKCIGCNTCMAACSEAHKSEGLQSQPRIQVTKTWEHTGPILCHHCEDAPCARVCPVNAIQMKGDSVQLDEKTCIGCKMCVLACPFGAITPNGTGLAGVAGIAVTMPNSQARLDPTLVWEQGVHTVAVKCDLCSSSEEGPACVRSCPTEALYLVEDDRLLGANSTKRETTGPQINPKLQHVMEARGS